MKKKFDTTSLANELRGASVFFQRPSPSPDTGNDPQQPDQNRTPERVSTRTSEPPNARTVDTPNERTSERRRVKRFSFELYEDQIEQVKRMALEDQLRGGKLNMSEVVRAAIDRYIAEPKKKGE